MKTMMREVNEIAKGNLSKEDMERGRWAARCVWHL